LAKSQNSNDSNRGFCRISGTSIAAAYLFSVSGIKTRCGATIGLCFRAFFRFLDMGKVAFKPPVF